MTITDLALDPEPEKALATIREASHEHRVLVFKKSPT